MGECLRRGFADRPASVSIEAAALVAVIEWIINEKKNFGELNTLCKQIVRDHGDGDSMSVTWAQLPTTVRGDVRPLDDWRPAVYRITFN